MKQFFLIFFFGFLYNVTITAQTTAKYEYYIEITGLNSKSAIKPFDALIAAKPNVVSFTGYNIPRSFYVLKSNIAITQSQLTTWINNNSYSIKKFEQKTVSNDFIKSKKGNPFNRNRPTKREGKVGN